MLTDFKKIAKNSIVYSLGNVATKLIGLILMPIYTNDDYLSINDYGILTDLEALTQLMIAILGIALYQSLTRWYWDKEMAFKKNRLVFTIVCSIIVFSVLLYIPFAYYIEGLSETFLHSKDHVFLLQLVFFTSFFQALGIIPFTLLKLNSKSAAYTGANVLRLLLTLGLTVYFVVFEKSGVTGIFKAQLIGSIALLIGFARYTIRNMEAVIDFKELYALLKYSLPLLLASISGVFLSIFDRFGLTLSKGFDSAAIYGLSFKISNTIKLVVVTSIQMAISPLIFQKMNEPDAPNFYKKTMNVIVLVVNVCVFMASAFAYEMVSVLAHEKEYLEAIYFIPILSFAVLFGAMKDMAITGLQIAKKTFIIAGLIFFVATLNFFLNYLSIPVMGIYGASLSTVFSQLVFFFLVYFYAQKHYTIPYKLFKNFFITLLTLIFILLAFLLQSLGLWTGFALKVVLSAVYIFVLMKFFTDKEEYAYLKGFINKWKHPGNIKENLKSLSAQKGK